MAGNDDFWNLHNEQIRDYSVSKELLDPHAKGEK